MSIKKQELKGKKECKVTFKISKEIVNGANKAVICGTFNNWNSNELEMKILKSTGEASISLTLKTGQDYQYKFVFDNSRWENDPEADDFVANEFGEKNSVIKL